MFKATVGYNPIAYWTQRGYQVPGDTEPLGILGQNMADWIKRYSRPGDLFLEVGSGYGRVYSFFEQRGLVNQTNYAMCDISLSMAEKCTERTGIKVDLWDGKWLPYADRSFDWVISANVMLHVPPDDIGAFIYQHWSVSRKYILISSYVGTGDNLAVHCFSHHYDLQFHDYKVIEYKHFEKERQGQWLLSI